MSDLSAERGGAPPALVDDSFEKDAYPEAFARFADQGPIHRVMMPGGLPIWMITSYADGRAALRDPRLIKDPLNVPDLACPMLRRRYPEDITAVMGRQPTNTDGTQHTNLRRVLAEPMSEAGVCRWQPILDDIVERRLDRLGENPSADLVADFANPLVGEVNQAVLGLPSSFCPDLMELARVLLGPDHPEAPHMKDAYRRFQHVLRRLVEYRESDLGEDVTSVLIRAWRSGRINRLEVTSTISSMILGACTPPANLISYGAAVLLDTPELRDAMREGAVEAVVQELLRLYPPLTFPTWRFAAEPIQIAGQAIQTGDVIMIALGAANRDPQAYPHRSQPSLGRPGRPSLSFGGGPHLCAGANLALREARTALPSLLARFPAMRLTVPLTQITWRGAVGGRIPTCVPVDLGLEGK